MKHKVLEVVAPPASSTSDISLCSDVLLIKAADGSARLFNLNGSFYAIDQVSARFLFDVLVYDRRTATEKIASDFGVPLLQVQRDLKRFVDDLVRQGLIKANGGLERNPTHSIAERMLIALPLAILHRGWLSDRIQIFFMLVLARLSFELFGWSRTIALWKRTNVASPVDSKNPGHISDLVRETATRHWLPLECKERALCCWTLLRWRGIQSALVMGIALYPLKGHCWCMFKDQVLADDEQRCQMFTPIVSY